ncbi:GtrA family protein [Martelella sp. HB161492]|uniref:GtrA family protein n=1 Tax=Martelella sp. HB161492 TaxID=2720726 RepID=UPI001590C828|nr:GtrA family protein [Martelella sp. HB161492]
MIALNASVVQVKRYIVFGGGSLLGAVIDYLGTLALNDGFGLPPAVALGFMMIISATVVFYYHHRITFRTAGDAWLRRYVRFMLLSALIFALRAVVLELLVACNLSVPLAVAAAIVLISVVNFAASSVFVFMKGGK